MQWWLRAAQHSLGILVQLPSTLCDVIFIRNREDCHFTSVSFFLAWHTRQILLSLTFVHHHHSHHRSSIFSSVGLVNFSKACSDFCFHLSVYWWSSFWIFFSYVWPTLHLFVCVFYSFYPFDWVAFLCPPLPPPPPPSQTPFSQPICLPFQKALPPSSSKLLTPCHLHTSAHLLLQDRLWPRTTSSFFAHLLICLKILSNFNLKLVVR